MVKPGNPQDKLGCVLFLGRKLTLHQGGYINYPSKFIQPRIRRNHPYILIRDNNGSQHKWQLGKIILMAKLKRNIKPSLVCCHNNGNPYDNRLPNLREDTKKSDVADKKKHGTHINPPLHIGEEQHLAKLTVKKVQEIRFLAKKYNQYQLAEIYQVNRSTIKRVIQRITWKQVPDFHPTKLQKLHILLKGSILFHRNHRIKRA